MLACFRYDPGMKEFYFTELLSKFDRGGRCACACGREHGIGTREVIVGRDALRESAALLSKMYGSAPVLWVLSDENTEEAAGMKWKSPLRVSRIVSRVLPADPKPVPTLELVNELAAGVKKESPDLLNHNIETVPRLYPQVRPQADYERSLYLLKGSKENYHHILTKSGFMLGLGETEKEILDLLQDLREVGCDFLTIGQYLQPRPDRLPVVRYIPPEEFEEYKKRGEEMGFMAIASGPFIRSSFHASQMFEDLQA